MNPIETLANFINKSQRILIFTGAGISTESGISDYRSKGGMWDRFKPVTIQEFVRSEEAQRLYWERKIELMDSMKEAQPNDGHKAIVEIEKMRKLKGIVTQNIDGLHHLAGNDPNLILEIHGTNREVICLSCQDLQPWQHAYDRLKAGEEVPKCHKCGGLLKPNTISFGQSLNPDVLDESIQWSQDCDLLLAVGSTLVVEPAASIPRIAKENGAWLAIITLSETPLDKQADLKIEDKAGEILGAALQLVKK